MRCCHVQGSVPHKVLGIDVRPIADEEVGMLGVAILAGLQWRDREHALHFVPWLRRNNHVRQSPVEIEYYSVAYFNYATELKALYLWTSVKGGAQTPCVNATAIYCIHV